MKIKKIQLKNIGPYVDHNGFDFDIANSVKRMILIGGKNGAGKTTLIRLICGLQLPTSGKFTLYGVSHSDKAFPESKRRMGAVVETPSIYLDMTAADNLRQQYRILGLPSFDGIDELLKLVGLSGTGKKKAKNFPLTFFIFIILISITITTIISNTSIYI